MSTAYPLAWPIGIPRTLYPAKAAFARRTVHMALDGVTEELEKTKATSVMVSSNYTLGPAPKDKGVCVYFKIGGKPYALPCDKWMTIEDNLWAVAKYVESMRLQIRWGVGSIEKAFAGFAALPGPGQTASAMWFETLGFKEPPSFEKAKDRWLQLSKASHPDNGGNHGAQVALNAAWDEAKKHYRQ